MHKRYWFQCVLKYSISVLHKIRLTPFWRLYCYLWTDFTHYSGVIRSVITYWEYLKKWILQQSSRKLNLINNATSGVSAFSMTSIFLIQIIMDQNGHNRCQKQTARLKIGYKRRSKIPNPRKQFRYKLNVNYFSKLLSQ